MAENCAGWLCSHETEQRNELSGTQAWRPARAGGRSAGQWDSEWACVAGAKHMFLLKELLGARGRGRRGGSRGNEGIGAGRKPSGWIFLSRGHPEVV